MTEVKIEMIKPHLYKSGDNIYFAIYGKDILSAGEIIGKIVKDNIGILRSYIFFDKGRAILRSSLKDYNANILSSRLSTRFKEIGIEFLLDFRTYKSRVDIENWRKIEDYLSNPEQEFDNYDKTLLVHRADRGKTLKNMKRLRGDLKKKIPKNYAEFKMIKIEFPDNRGEESLNFGYVGLLQGKDKSNGNVKKCKADLISKLEEFEEIKLSPSAPLIFYQANRFANNVSDLQRDFGRIWFDSHWKERLFRF